MTNLLKNAALVVVAAALLSACAVPVAPSAQPTSTSAAASGAAAPTAANTDAPASKSPQATSTPVTINSDAPSTEITPTVGTTPVGSTPVGSTPEPTAEVTATREMIISPANLDSLELQVKESKPVTVNAIVKGTLGDGCTNLNAIEQKRDGNTFTIDVTVKRPKDAMCTMIAKLLNETVALDVAGLKAGTYIVAAGTLSQTFTLAADN